MFAAKEEIRLKVEAVMKHLATLDRGDILKYEDIERLAQCERYGKQWGTIIGKIKRRLEKERGINVFAVINIGYKLCTTQEHLTDWSLSGQRRSHRNLFRVQRGVSSIRAHELSPFQQRNRAIQVAAMRNARKAIRDSMAEQTDHLTKSVQPMPRPKRPNNGQQEQSA